MPQPPTSVTPLLPKPPASYDQRYMNQLVAAIDGQLRALTQPGYAVVSGILTINMPTSAVGLRAGEVYNDGGTLKVAP